MQKYNDVVLRSNGSTSRPVAGATITVTQFPSGAAATIYSDNGVTPITTLVSDATGAYAFYAADGRYSITVSGAGFTTKTLTDVLIEDPADGAVVSSSGDVVGPSSSVNGRVAIFSGTTGKLIADSGLTLSGVNTGDETTTTSGALINGATAKATPVDADMLGLVDSAASNILKKLSWANLKATLKTYFDTLYAAAGSGVADGDKGDITVSSSGATWTVDNDVVTYAKMQNVSAASMLLGRGSAGGAGDPQEITVGSGLTMTGTTLSASGGGSVAGSDTQVQFNDAGAFGGDVDFTWNKTTNTLALGVTATPATVTGAQGSASGAGAALTVKGGAGGATTGAGGVLNLFAGSPSASGTGNHGGAINLTSGTGLGTSSNGGDINITAGIQGSSGTAGAINILCSSGGGGAINITAGSKTTSTAGALALSAGTSSSGAAGAATLTGGDGSTPGACTVRAGDGTANNSSGATLTLRGGASLRSGTSGAPAPGLVAIVGGAATGTTNSATGGAVTVTGGQGGITNGSGGNVSVIGGAPQGTGVRGNVELGGNAAALATTATGGFITIPTCAGTPTGVPASVATGQVAMVYDTTNHKLYVYDGGWKTTTVFA